MNGHKNVIELNGKLYDSTTGTIISRSHQKDAAPKIIEPTLTPIKPKTSAHSGHVLDGFTRRPQAAAHKKTSPAPAPHPKSRNAKTSPKHVTHHAPHRAHTLMRRGLKKPTLGSEQALHAQTTTQQTQHRAHNAARASRAQTTETSPNISRFGSFGLSGRSFIKKSVPLDVQPAPAEAHTHAHHTPKLHAAHHTPKQSTQHEVVPPTHNQLVKEHLVAQALKNARVPEAHEHTHKTRRKHRVSKKLGVSPKVLHTGAATLAIILLGGFFAYQNAPNISMRIASARAGFNATIPGYKPAGFGMSGPIEYGPGQVTLNFRSNSDSRNFHVTQKVSNWNSDALLTNFVTAQNKSYQTFQDKGRTIYIYDGSSATWVSGGVWYQIEGKSSLSSDQLIRLASSI